MNICITGSKSGGSVQFYPCFSWLRMVSYPLTPILGVFITRSAPTVHSQTRSRPHTHSSFPHQLLSALVARFPRLATCSLNFDYIHAVKPSLSDEKRAKIGMLATSYVAIVTCSYDTSPLRSRRICCIDVEACIRRNKLPPAAGSLTKTHTSDRESCYLRCGRHRLDFGSVRMTKKTSDITS
ncbi:hypothetical protein RSOL_075390 [Rhizoctonia solani AG-3 Rhs1AP]|uniref:Uncharacterized protein n=2 Tax=Rhizoctonia solani AG-3 TaxID=1086053 RepID=A0A074S4M6_9AGAM|nr:hypothetical protein RSOL_075390 [Rhizoctonia solani AG-3 Rhs1AP]KEP51813.1 hypothetical protein V565_055250 [Rhizoctonia solani 123E]